MKSGCNLLFCGLLWLSAGGALAATGVVSATAEVDRSVMKIGDKLRLSVVVEYPEGYRVDSPGSRVNLGQFGILDVQTREPRKQSGRVSEGVDYDISTYFTGDFTIPAIRIHYSDPSGASNEVVTDALHIKVEGVGADDAKADIRDVAPPVVVWGPRTREYLVYGGAAAAVLLAVLYWLWRKRRIFATPAEPPVDPWVKALARLDALRDGEIVGQGLRREFATELSEIVRDYLFDRFGVPGPNMATYEILAACRNHGELASHVPTVDAVQRGCDLVKFAKYEPPQEEMRAVLEHAYRLVSATTPAPVIAPETPEETREPAEVGA